jgi:hypothetical protein
MTDRKVRVGSAGTGSRFRLSLVDRSTLRRVPRADPSEVQTWFGARAPMTVPRVALAILDQWRAELRGEAPPSFPGWRPEGPGRTPVEAAPLIALLREHALSGEPFTFNALWREKQGGRMYPFMIPAYRGPITISKRQYEGSRPRHLLAAIRRDVRAVLEPPPGSTLLELDFKSCHAAIGFALSGDAQLGADLDGDIHQVVGNLVLPQGDERQRRDFGKSLNNAMFFGQSPHGFGHLAKDYLGVIPPEDLCIKIWNGWWVRYPRLADFRDRVNGLVLQAQASRGAVEIEAPSGRTSRFSPAEVLGEVGAGRPAPGPGGAWRSVFSACFRAVEGDVLNQTLRHFHADSEGGRLVLPLYDGMLVAAPAGSERPIGDALMRAAERAVQDLGIPRLRPQLKKRSAPPTGDLNPF